MTLIQLCCSIEYVDLLRVDSPSPQFQSCCDTPPLSVPNNSHAIRARKAAILLGPKRRGGTALTYPSAASRFEELNRAYEGKSGTPMPTAFFGSGVRWWFLLSPRHQGVDRQDDEEVDRSGDNQERNQRIEKVAVSDLGTVDFGNQVRKVWFADNRGDQWSQDVFDEGGDYRTEGRAYDNADGQVHDVSTQEELLKTFEHVSLPSSELRDMLLDGEDNDKLLSGSATGG